MVTAGLQDVGHCPNDVLPGVATWLSFALCKLHRHGYFRPSTARATYAAVSDVITRVWVSL